MAASADKGTDVDASAEPFAVYVHWPFCAAICPYCDFNVHLAENVDHGRWRRALVAELDHFAGETRGRRVASVFFGGGTPSLMEPETVAAVIGALRDRWAVADDLEVSLEANPSSAEAGRFQAYREAGVNRLSLGVQAFSDSSLRFLGRDHSAADAKQAIAIAAATFERFSFDLIYGLPGQSAADWRDELDRAIPLAGSHLSLYQLAIEPGTAFHKDRVPAADEDTGAALFEMTQAVLSAAGLPAYEVSNHARAGAECRHNLVCWRGGDYLGIGPGAHGRLTGPGGAEALHQVHSPARWLDRVEENGHGTAKRRKLSPEARAAELVMTGLRLTEGIDRTRFQHRAGVALDDVLDHQGLASMIRGGFIEANDRVFRATAPGRIRLDAVLGRLLAKG